MGTSVATPHQQASVGNSYDQIPYRSYPYPQTHPARMATIATLLGLQPPAIEQARVLELACGRGGNLAPIAEMHPQATFVGIDLSVREIADGQDDIERAGLKNISLHCMDILDIGPDLGQFDYIIAHGVFSWVPTAVQEKILRVCKENLSPRGVAYISYNTYPGWRVRGIVRDIMLYRARSFVEPTERINHARQLMDFLAQSVSRDDNAYGAMLRRELERLHDKDDQYLIHEQLESNNEPLYFHEFAERARAAGLQYLAEANYESSCARNLPPNTQAVLKNVSADVIELEQYLDFMKNRMFRQTLLVHDRHHVERDIRPDRLLNLFIASDARPEKPVQDLRSTDPVVFRRRQTAATTVDPLLKAAFVILAEVWPASMPVSELIGMATGRLDRRPAVVDSHVVTLDTMRLLEPLLRCFEVGQVELSVQPSPSVTEVSQRPQATSWARRQSETSNLVTNLRHEIVQLNDLQRHVLQCLDGTCDLPAIEQNLVMLASQGSIVIHHEGKAIRDEACLHALLTEPVAVALKNMAAWSLLTG